MKMINVFLIVANVFTVLNALPATSSNGLIVSRDTLETMDCCVGDGVPSRSAMIAKAMNSSNNEVQEAPSDAGMVFIKGGIFQIGSEAFGDALPIREVEVGDFWMDEHEVTNAQFAAFVTATGYVTVAERALDPTDYPGVPEEVLVPGSAVFTASVAEHGLGNHLQWWTYVPGASWRHPKGSDSSIEGKENEPVVQVAYEDAVAYAAWAGKRLSTEAEWEYAARAGRPHTTYYWGEEKTPGGTWLANIYQGTFPTVNSAEDQYVELAPVKSFPPNPLGLYDMEGNVWEWCSDVYRSDAYAHVDRYNPTTRREDVILRPDEPVMRVQRGGSFLCNDQYCERYKAGSRGSGEETSASNNVGFRCVKDL